MEAVRTVVSAHTLTPIVDLPWKSRDTQVELIVVPLGETASRQAARRKITDLKGLGREVWQSISVEDHLKKERAAWD